MTLEKQIAEDYGMVLKEAQSMGCNKINALYNIPLDNMKAIVNALEEVQKYRAIGTPAECRLAVKFKEYFDELYGNGLEVVNWHQNGDTEPFDNFYESALDRGDEK